MDLKKKSFVSLIILSLILSIFVWRTEWFQYTVFPKKYWTEKVHQLECDIRISTFMIRDTNIELAKMTVTINFDIAQAANSAEMAGLNEKNKEMIIKETTNTKIQEIDNQRKSIGIMENMLSEKQKELEIARQKMEKLH